VLVGAGAGKEPDVFGDTPNAGVSDFVAPRLSTPSACDVRTARSSAGENTSIR